jgi:colicin import membrane protein
MHHKPLEGNPLFPQGGIGSSTALHLPRDNSLAFIALFVVAAHVGLLFWLAVSPSSAKQIVPMTKRLVVTTISLNEQRDILLKEPNVSGVETFSQEPEELSVFREELEIPKVEETHGGELAPQFPQPPQPAIQKKQEVKAELKKETPPQRKETLPIKKQETSKQVEQKKPASTKKTTPQKAETNKTDSNKGSTKTKEKEKRDESAKKEIKPNTSKKEEQTAKSQPSSQKIKQDTEEKVIRAKQRELLTKAQENIAKIAQSRDKVSSGKVAETSILGVPGPISRLQVEELSDGNFQSFSDREVGYREELASRLKLLLRLPEYGAVKVKLTLERTGKVVKVIVIGTESSANRSYIEKTLPTLTFPAFGTGFGDAAQHTFSISLSNDL